MKTVKKTSDPKVRSENFNRVAGSRVTTILTAIKVLTRCAEKDYYEYNGEDVELMFDAIEKELRKSKETFNAKLTEPTVSSINTKFSFNRDQEDGKDNS